MSKSLNKALVMSHQPTECADLGESLWHWELLYHMNIFPAGMDPLTGYVMCQVYVVRRSGRLAPRQPLSVCALLPAPREEQASTASWEPRPPFEAAEMD